MVAIYYMSSNNHGPTERGRDVDRTVFRVELTDSSAEQENIKAPVSRLMLNWPACFVVVRGRTDADNREYHAICCSSTTKLSPSSQHMLQEG